MLNSIYGALKQKLIPISFMSHDKRDGGSLQFPMSIHLGSKYSVRNQPSNGDIYLHQLLPQCYAIIAHYFVLLKWTWVDKNNKGLTSMHGYCKQKV